jgi:hypothetical protein
MGKSQLVTALRQLVLEAIPEIKGKPYKVKGKVIKTYETGPYAVDIQVLGRDDLPDPDFPVLPAVEAPALWTGSAQGVYGVPPVGSLVRVGFYYNDPGQPYIDAVLSSGSIGDHAAGKLVIAADTEITIAANSAKIEAQTVEITAPVTTIDGSLTVTGTINGTTIP